MDQELFLPGLPADLIEAVYRSAPGNEIDSGKFASPESSAALVANAFGFFLASADQMPPLPGLADVAWPAQSMALEGIVRFPWAGGRHPCLDVLVSTPDALIGVESKRFEPFRTKGPPNLSDAYWRPVWGDRMSRYERLRDQVRDRTIAFAHLDATQLIKHAFGLRTAVQDGGPFAGRRAILFYLHAEPERWPDARAIDAAARDLHAAEVRRFSDAVAGDEVVFRACSYRTLLQSWNEAADPAIKLHSSAVATRFAP